MVAVRAYPFDRLPKLSRDDATVVSAAARWLGARPLRADGALARLVGTSIGATVARVADAAGVALGAACDVRVADAVIRVVAPGLLVRALAQRLLGGPDELGAPRPVTAVERAVLALAVAAALDDLGVAGEVWPLLDDAVAPPAHDTRAIEIVVAPAAAAQVTVVAHVPRALALRVPPVCAQRWTEHLALALPVVLGRCAIAATAVATLAVRDVVTLDRAAGDGELVIGAGAIGIAIARGAVEATVATGYVARDMALPDDAHLELAVTLGTARLSLRQLAELAVGQIIALGRPLAGPFELRAGGRLIGHGELVDVDGELAVRVTSLGDGS